MTIFKLFCLFLQNCPVWHVAGFPRSHHIYENQFLSLNYLVINSWIKFDFRKLKWYCNPIVPIKNCWKKISFIQKNIFTHTNLTVSPYRGVTRGRGRESIQKDSPLSSPNKMALCTRVYRELPIWSSPIAP